MKRFFILFVSVFLVAQDRAHNAPYITGDGFRHIANHLYDETSKAIDIKSIAPYDSIFVKGDYITEFAKRVAPKIRVPFILISHNSDDGPEPKHSSLANHRHLVAWFAQNVFKYAHHKIIPIPIGIENNYCLEEVKFDWIKKLSKKNLQKTILMYINCAIGTNPREREPLYSDRMKKLFEVENRILMRPFMKKLARSKFVASPPGNGFDCHRTWEALYVGTFPIVKKSISDPLFAELPVFLVDSYTSLTPVFLERKYLYMKRKKYNMDKIKMEYWWDKIHKAQRR